MQKIKCRYFDDDEDNTTEATASNDLAYIPAPGSPQHKDVLFIL